MERQRALVGEERARKETKRKKSVLVEGPIEGGVRQSVCAGLVHGAARR